MRFQSLLIKREEGLRERVREEVVVAADLVAMVMMSALKSWGGERG